MKHFSIAFLAFATALFATANVSDADVVLELTATLDYVGGAADPGLDGEVATWTYTFLDTATAQSGGPGVNFFNVDSVTLDILGQQITGTGSSLFAIASAGDATLGIGGAPDFNIPGIGLFNFSASVQALENLAFPTVGDFFTDTIIANAEFTNSQTPTFVEAGSPDAFFQFDLTQSTSISIVPEPGSAAVLGLMGFATMLRRRKV